MLNFMIFLMVLLPKCMILKIVSVNVKPFILLYTHSLPLSKVAKFVEFARFLFFFNVSALNGIKMDQTATIYKFTAHK